MHINWIESVTSPDPYKFTIRERSHDLIMSFRFCIICFTRKLHHSNQIHPRQQYPSSFDLTSELKDSRKFSLNSVCTFKSCILLLLIVIFGGPTAHGAPCVRLSGTYQT